MSGPVIRQTWAEAYYAQHGIEPYVKRGPTNVFDVDADGSQLLRAMKARLEEVGWLDENGKLLFAELATLEKDTRPLMARIGEWWESNTLPVDEWDEWDENTNWRDLGRW